MASFRKYSYLLLLVLNDLILLTVLLISYPLIWILRRGGIFKSAIYFGGTPIISHSHWARALAERGYNVVSIALGLYTRINDREDWDVVVDFTHPTRAIVRFYHLTFSVLLKAEAIFLTFDGFLLRGPISRYLEPIVLKSLRIKTVAIPYGSDAYVYSRTGTIETTHALNLSYPENSRRQRRIERNVHRWNHSSDVVIPTLMGLDGLGRWDVLMPSAICVDVRKWKISQRPFNESRSKFFISHSPNHRGFKGTSFIVCAVNELIAEGLQIELVLIEGKKNTEVKAILEEKIDLHIEQIIATGYALSAIEGMAAGLPVIANLESKDYQTLFSRWSFLGECPIISSTPENIKDVIREIISDRELQKKLAADGRRYVEKFHSYSATADIIEEIIAKLRGSNVNLLDYYMPQR